MPESVTPILQLTDVRVAVRDLRWFHAIGPGDRVAPGQPAPTLLRVPAAEANRVLQQTVRLVADLPRGSSGLVVWQQGGSELAVRTKEIALACAEGLVTITFPVRCDQLSKDERVAIPLAVGTEARPAGLVLSALTRPQGPAVVTQLWAEALTAFAWEALVHLAQQLCAAVGKDTTGKPLVPGSIAAARNTLLLQPMARHALSWRP